MLSYVELPSIMFTKAQGQRKTTCENVLMAGIRREMALKLKPFKTS